MVVIHNMFCLFLFRAAGTNYKQTEIRYIIRCQNVRGVIGGISSYQRKVGEPIYPYDVIKVSFNTLLIFHQILSFPW